MKKIKYLAVFLAYCTLFSCSNTDISSISNTDADSASDTDTSSTAKTDNTFQAHIETSDNETAFHEAFLVVEDGEEKYTHELFKSHSDVMYTGDIDGDGDDEIIVNQLVGVTGGVGSYYSYVFDYENGNITELFSSHMDDMFDTGFSSKLKDNYIVEFSNTFTGFSTEIDYYRNSNLFNDDGTVANGKNDSDHAMFDSFREFKPEDVDGDGICEILCLQFTAMNSHVEYVGDAQSYLKYNSDNKQFEVIKADFITRNGDENILEIS
ncbi:MAG: hypothetical protein K2K91_01160 [Ruminococcus sp.]|nr:hypothetical protein [Ruminococcus sp.]